MTKWKEQHGVQSYIGTPMLLFFDLDRVVRSAPGQCICTTHNRDDYTVDDARQIRVVRHAVDFTGDDR